MQVRARPNRNSHFKVRVVFILAWYWKMGSTGQSEEGLSECSLKVSFRRVSISVQSEKDVLMSADAELSQ
jgi:hypothetical protein